MSEREILHYGTASPVAGWKTSAVSLLVEVL